VYTCIQNVFHVVAAASSRNAQRKSKEKDAVNFGQSMRRSNITACDDGPVILAEYGHHCFFSVFFFCITPFYSNQPTIIIRTRALSTGTASSIRRCCRAPAWPR
jgi:hypothetical protein